LISASTRSKARVAESVMSEADCALLTSSATPIAFPLSA
jgi:hypothetical protein